MKTIAFDLDDVICWHHPQYDELGVEKYKYCEPIESGVELVNEYYDNGYRIVIYTARGMGAYKGNLNKIYESLYELTYDSLVRWGVKFHRLMLGKLDYDLLIDDKVISSFLATRERIEEYFQE